jgi:hypothetical protein
MAEVPCSRHVNSRVAETLPMKRCDLPRRGMCRKRLTFRVRDGSQPPMTFDLSPELNGWLPFAAPIG